MCKLKAEFTSYMKIALKNDCIDYYRIQARKNKISEASIYDIEELEVSISHYADIDSFFGKFTLDEISNPRLYMAVEQLTNRQREIISLYAEGLTITEIANYLKVSNGTIKAAISKIKKKIIKSMKG